MRPRTRLAGGIGMAATVLLSPLPACHSGEREPSVPATPVALAAPEAPAASASVVAAPDAEVVDGTCTSVLMAMASFVARSPCGVAGALGLRWGERAERAGARIGAACTEWRPSFVSADFEQCDGAQPVMAYGARARVTLVRREQRLAAVLLHFDQARWQDLRDAARGELALSGEEASSEAPYIVFANDSLVRVEPERGGDGVSVVAADPAFGKVYASYVLGQGLGGLFRVH